MTLCNADSTTKCNTLVKMRVLRYRLYSKPITVKSMDIKGYHQLSQEERYHITFLSRRRTLIHKKDWSPKQISAYFRKYGLFSISHETIYRYILADKKQDGVLYTHLRIMPKVRLKRYNSKDSRGILPGKHHISQRPGSVENRLESGHWEADTTRIDFIVSSPW